jgi:hypothetical protein
MINKIYQSFLHLNGRQEATISVEMVNGRAYVRLPWMTPDRLHDVVVIEDFPIDIKIALLEPGSNSAMIEVERSAPPADVARRRP